MSYELSAPFETAVLETSRRHPVLVDFWAAWCGPCRILGPVLERLAAEAGDRWELVKIDTDAHQEVAGQYQIRAIPTVILFRDGEPVDRFQGALPEAAIRKWLDDHLAADSGSPGPSLAQAEAAMAAGRLDEARRLLQESLDAEPENTEARLALARTWFYEDPPRSEEIASAIPAEAPEGESARGLLHLLRLMAWGRGDAGSPVESEGPQATRYRDAARALAEGDLDRALTLWVEVVSGDRSLDDDGARRACVALFDLLGDGHPLAAQHRRRLSSALF